MTQNADIRRTFEKISQQNHELRRRVKKLENAPADLRNAAIDGGKGLLVKADGQETIRLGDHGIEHRGGPAPEQPEAPFVDAGGETVKIQHSGLDVYESPAPANFRRAHVHVSQVETFEPGLSTLAGYMDAPDGSFTHRLPGGEWYVGVVWETLSGKHSPMSETVLADVAPLVDADEIQEALDTAQERLDQAEQDFQAGNEARKAEIANLRDTVIPGLEESLNGKADSSALSDLDAKLATNLAAIESHYSRIWRQSTPPPAGTHYAWLGERHASESVMLDEHGVELARNLFGYQYSHHSNAGYNPARWTSAVVAIEPNTTYTVTIRGKQTNRFSLWQDPLENGILAPMTHPDGRISLIGRDYYSTAPGDDIVHTVTTHDFGGYLVMYLSNEGPAEHQDLIMVEPTDKPTHYFDGSTASDRAHDLWYNADGVPHEWVSGQGWTVLDDQRLADLVAGVEAAQTTADSAVADAATAQTTADQAVQEALDAAGIADSKGRIIPADAAPTGDLARPENLWVNTTDSKVYTWVDGAWTVVTDPGIAQAANDAASAQARADEAHEDAGTAQATADSALTMAGTKTTVTYSESAPAGTASIGDTHRQQNATGDIVAEWEYTATGWAKRQVSSDAISNLDVGKLTAGSADLTEAVVGKLWGQLGVFERLDAREGWIGGVALEDGAVGAEQVNVEQLFSDEAVINKVWSDIVRAGLLTAEEALIGGALIKDKTLDINHINVTEQLTAAIAQFLTVKTDMLEANAVTADKIGTDAIEARHISAKAIEADMIDAGAIRTEHVDAKHFVLSDSDSDTRTSISATGMEVIESWVDYPDPKLEDPDLLKVRHWTMDGWDNYRLSDINGTLLFPDTERFAVRLKITVHSTDGLEIRAHGRSTPESGSAWRTYSWPITSTGVSNIGVPYHAKYPYFAWMGIRGDVTVDEMWVRPRVNESELPILSVTKEGLKAWDASGSETASIGSGGQNFISGRLTTNSPGQPGVVLSEDRGPEYTQGAGIWFADDGTTGEDQAAIWAQSTVGTYPYTEYDILNIRAPSGGNVRHRSRSYFNELVDFDGHVNVWGTLYVRSSISILIDRTTSYNANLYLDRYGLMYKTSSASRYKLDQQVMHISDDLLDLELKDWIDKAQVDRREAAEQKLANLGPGDTLTEEDAADLGNPIERIPGVVAEDVEAIDDRFVLYNDDGQVENVMYERLALTWIPIVRRQRDRITALEEQNAGLEARLARLEEKLS